MKEVVFVTGNDLKFREIQDQLPEFNLRRKKLDLDEIQSLDIIEVTKHKLKQAYSELKCPVMVDDTAFELEALNGLPGPLLKWFDVKLGDGSVSTLIEGKENRNGKGVCTISYYDGEHFIIGYGEIKGEVIDKNDSRVNLEGKGVGFDYYFVPEGYSETFPTLGLDVKKKISHRALAIKDFKEKYKEVFG